MGFSNRPDYKKPIQMLLGMKEFTGLKTLNGHQILMRPAIVSPFLSLEIRPDQWIIPPELCETPIRQITDLLIIIQWPLAPGLIKWLSMLFLKHPFRCFRIILQYT